MKKFLAVCLALLMMVSTAVIAFAQGGFVASPSGNEAPVVEEVIYEDGSCEPEIVVTPYSERDTLEEDKEDDMNKAYKEIAANKDLTKLCPELAGVASAKGIPAARLAVSDLFDVSAYHTLDHNYCGSITIKLSAETLKNFVALIHRGNDGKWEVIENAVVDAKNETLTFSSSDFSPFAIVVDKKVEATPDTGLDSYMKTIVIPVIAIVISAVTLTGLLFAIKKEKKAV